MPYVLIAGHGSKYAAAPAQTSYTYAFTAAETPLSDGGKWTNTGLDWTNVQASGTEAYGTQSGSNNYDDSYSVYQPNVGNDYELEATVFRSGTPDLSGDSHEVELLLRVTQSAHSVTLYECVFGYAANSFYAGIAKWLGPLGLSQSDFPTVASDGGAMPSLVTGDKVKARVQGSTITVYAKGTQIMQVTGETTYATGKPGIGFFKRPGGTNAEFGFSDIRITPL